MAVKIYHNARCSKSRETLGLLEERQLDVEIISYLETPPSVTELKDILTMLGCEPEALMRRQEPEYKAAGLDDISLSRDEKIALMVANPKVIERPIVVANGKAAVGRPPQNILNIL